MANRQGALRFTVFEDTITAWSFIAFCQRLLRDAPAPAYLIVDGHPPTGPKQSLIRTKASQTP